MHENNIRNGASQYYNLIRILLMPFKQLTSLCHTLVIISIIIPIIISNHYHDRHHLEIFQEMGFNNSELQLSLRRLVQLQPPALLCYKRRLD